MSKNIVEPGRPQMKIWRKALYAVTWGYKYTLRICNACCFFTATMVATLLSVILYVFCL